MLDVSTSIGSENFTKVKQFVINFVENIDIGPNDTQVGTIIFNEDAYISFKLDANNDEKSLLAAINNIDYLTNFTNVEDALCRLTEGFQEENGGRNLSHGVFRIAIVLTDGKSNQDHSVCGWDTIEEAAEAVHKLGVLVYVIAVGHFNYSELKKIASEVPGSITYLSNFDYLEGEQDMRLDDMCKKGWLLDSDTGTPVCISHSYL